MFRCYCFDVIDFWLDSATAKDFVFALNHMHKNVSGHKLGKAGKKNHRTILVRPLHTQFTQAGLENPVLHWRHFFPAAVRFKLLRLKWSGFHAKTSADPSEPLPDGLTQRLLANFTLTDMGLEKEQVQKLLKSHFGNSNPTADTDIMQELAGVLKVHCHTAVTTL
jgi:hypothetical protein